MRGRDCSTRPLCAPGQRFDSYPSAIRHLDPPRLFESRPSYRLLGKQLSAGTLHFGLAAYFDKIDVSETLGHELAIAEGSINPAVPLTAEPVERYARHEPTQAAGAALLRLAWRHRPVLLG